MSGARDERRSAPERTIGQSVHAQTGGGEAILYLQSVGRGAKFCRFQRSLGNEALLHRHMAPLVGPIEKLVGERQIAVQKQGVDNTKK